MRFRRVISMMACIRSPAERITYSPKHYDASTPRERGTPQHVDDTFCSYKL